MGSANREPAPFLCLPPNLLPEREDGVQRHLEVLDSEGNPHDGDAEDEAAHPVDDGDLPPAQQNPDQIHDDGQAARLAGTVHQFMSEGPHGVGSKLEGIKDAEVNIFDGKCPAGNVGVQVNNIAPVNKGEVVWTIGDPTVVLFIGRLFNTGKVNLIRTVALCGSEINSPAYVDMLVGEELSTLLSNSYDASKSVRIINGNVLTGKPTTKEGYLGAHTSEITVIPEGNDADEMLGWILPRFKQFSVNRSYFSWLCGKKSYALDARIKGGERHIIMSGEYDKVLPMDIYGEYLIKAIITGDIDRQEALGIYEVSPEDFALAEFVDSSKLELQRIVREGLNILRKENA